MKIKQIKTDKKQFLPLLLLADEQEEMIDQYLERGTMYVLEEYGIVKAECVVIEAEKGILEIKNLAVAEEFQKKGYGKAMIKFVIQKYKGQYEILQVGTGDSPLTLPFYEKCGFQKSHCVKDFFIKHYDHPIYEAGIRLKDMIYLQRKFMLEE